MDSKNINSITNNIVFQKIDEEAYNSYIEHWKPSVNNSLEPFSYDVKRDKFLETSLVQCDVKESISIYYCFSEIRKCFRFMDFFNTINSAEQENANSNIFKNHAKYIDYLCYHKEDFDIKNIHKFFVKDLSVNYIDLIDYLILSKIYDRESFDKYSNLLIFLISKIDDLKLDFFNKWGPFLHAISVVCIKYSGLNHSYQVNPGKVKPKRNSKNNNINSNNVSFHNMYTTKAYDNFFENCTLTTKTFVGQGIQVNSKFQKMNAFNFKAQDEIMEFLLSMIKPLIKLIYKLNVIKDKSYDFFKYLIDFDKLFQVANPIKFESYVDSLTLGSLGGTSNYNIIKEGLKAHKSNLKKMKKYIDNFNENDIEEIKKCNDILTFIIFTEYFNEFKDSFNKYFQNIEKIKI